ncbi:cupin domain-containing protein [Acidisoma cellulosilytica]|uniref:Cupin domain-containing protein n=1 Tax=Acidisoma cellulosilyticum TaxID=2802395 RepID=A0A963Z8A9_9PROT|nr:cupin domain-containing protein [Acidisoma cellulosilyticum]MCB8883707.1 cupin domain-containing protein [Acidisoma cellulosilyticum]
MTKIFSPDAEKALDRVQAAGTEADIEDKPVGAGARLRIMRQGRNWTLQDLSARSGISVSMLSQLERDIASPSIRTLQRLAEIFHVTMGWFFDETRSAATGPAWVQRRTQRRVLDLPSRGCRKEMLCSGEGHIQLMIVTVAPQGSSGDSTYTHAGEDAGTVLEGSLTLEVDGDEQILNAGDSFRFPATLPHRFSNSGSVQCVVIWAVTPPLY